MAMFGQSGAGAALAPLALAFAPTIALAVLAVAAELRRPWRRAVRPDGLRWLQSSLLTLVGAGAVRLLLPLSIFSAGTYASAAGIGLFNRIEAPFWLAFAAGFLALDAADYARHRLEHKFALIWRIHRVHHSDRQLDASTALRFHPLEVLLTSSLHVAVIVTLGAPVAAALTYVAVLSVFDMWQHANIRGPRALDALDAIVITPRLHRMHHSDAAEHQAVNMGAVLCLWDRILGTYRRPSAAEAEAVQFGLGQGAVLGFDTLGQLLGDPLRNEGRAAGAPRDKSGLD